MTEGRSPEHLSRSFVELSCVRIERDPRLRVGSTLSDERDPARPNGRRSSPASQRRGDAHIGASTPRRRMRCRDGRRRDHRCVSIRDPQLRDLAPRGRDHTPCPHPTPVCVGRVRHPASSRPERRAVENRSRDGRCSVDDRASATSPDLIGPRGTRDVIHVSARAEERSGVRFHNFCSVLHPRCPCWRSPVRASWTPLLRYVGDRDDHRSADYEEVQEEALALFR